MVFSVKSHKLTTFVKSLKENAITALFVMHFYSVTLSMVLVSKDYALRLCDKLLQKCIFRELLELTFFGV